MKAPFNMRTLVLLVFGCLLLPGVARTAPAINAGELDVTVLSCTAESAIRPTVVVDRFTSPASSRPVRFTTTPDNFHMKGVFHTRLRLSAANYVVSVKSGVCQTQAAIIISVFPGLERHVVLATTNKCCAIPSLFNSGLAIAVPSGVGVALISNSRTNLKVRQVTPDQGVFYFDGVPPDAYTIRLTLPFAHACIPVDVTYAALSGYQRFIKLELSDIAHAMEVSRDLGSQDCES